MKSMNRRNLAVVFTMIVILGVSLFTVEARYKPTTGSNWFSRDQEIQEGQKAAADVNRQMPVLPDSHPIVQYVQHLGSELVANAPGEKWPYNFHVVNVKEINAFALPGGPIYVNMGTILAADNEAQLAGVMSHEISHVVQRHSTRAATKQMMAQAPLSVLGGLLGGSMGSQLVKMGISFGAQSYFLKNSRKNESEADLVGTDIMYDTGYDARQMAVFFEKLESQVGNGGSLSQFLSDHPNPGNRVEAVTAEVNSLPQQQTSRRDSDEFQRIKRLAAEYKGPQTPVVPQPEIADSGVDVTASKKFATFQHNAYRIGYPENWQVNGDNQSAVTIAPQGGVSANAVAYGVIISDFQPENTRDLDQGTHELIASMKQSNPELRVVGNDEDIHVNGLPAKSVELLGTSPIKSERERDWLVTVADREGNVHYLVFIAPQKDFERLHSAFESMLHSFSLQQ